jgi:arylsulfatase A-like enzyme
MNFQAVSVGQKLAKGNPNDPADAGLIGGYADAAGRVPNNGLASGLDYADGAIGRMVAALSAKHLDRSTLIIITAKHGQSPIDHARRQAVDDGAYGAVPDVDFFQTDDVALIWLKKSAQARSYAAARQYLETQKGPLGIVKILDRDELTSLYQDPFKDNKTPDFIAITTPGLIYTGGSKLAEHGGFADDDRNVGLLISNPALSASINGADVETRQVAPTILRALGISPGELKAVTQEDTDVLPGLFGRDR